MRQTYEKLKSAHALSAIETICIFCLAAMAVAGLSMGFLFYRKSIKMSNDNRLVETALRAASLNSIGGGCVVDGCDDEEGCPHMKNGVNIGYLDHNTNTIVAELPTGYNEYSIMIIQGREFRGKVGAMVIEIQFDGETYRASWVRGRWDVR